jgi:opacity protein-like surface antigen
MKRMLFVAAALGALAAPSAMADKIVDYVKVFGGATTTKALRWGGAHYDTDTGWNSGGALGWNVTSHLALESELFYDRVEYHCCNPNSNTSWSGMVNGIWQFNSGFTPNPYVGVGLGLDHVRYHNDTGHYTRTDNVGGYQLISGFTYPLANNLDLMGEYRYRGAFTQAEDSGLKWEYQSNNFSGGLRIKF